MITTIPEGYTYEYLPHGFGIGLLGAILAFFIHPIFMLLIVVGVAIAAAKAGVEIDSNGMRMRKYYSYIFFKRGEWVDLKTVNKLILTPTTHNEGGANAMGLAKGTVRTFDLFLITDLDEKIHFNDFTKVSAAFKTVDKLQEIRDFELENLVKQKYVVRTKRDR